MLYEYEADFLQDAWKLCVLYTSIKSLYILNKGAGILKIIFKLRDCSFVF